MTFGKVIRQERLKLGLSQKELSALILKENGRPITQQYLNDLEHERRNVPPPSLIEQFAKALKLEPEFLYYLAGEIPADWVSLQRDRKRIVAGYKALYKELIKSTAA
jgi:transcriptional regulator with XRE-family HTH domain